MPSITENTELRDPPHRGAPDHAALDSESCWRAVLNRDRSQSGVFVYAVHSTGIFCRPGCPSRRPGREQVRFFASSGEATAAGYRACRRCQPEEPDAGMAAIAGICRSLSDHPDIPPDLDDAGRKAGVSQAYLRRLFKRITGVSIREYADQCRLGLLKDRLRNGDSVTMAIYEAGYSSASRVYERADSRLGMEPAAYRRGGRGALIRYAAAGCSLGVLLVAGTENGICFVSLGDGEAELLEALRQEYPAAAIEADGGRLAEWVQAVLTYLESRSPSPDLPLDIRATAFQKRVWKELQAIPMGETRTYTEVAEAVGRPAAVRAVAHACAVNPVSLLVPCHRVVRKDGSLAGYRWGLARKQALLEQEKGAC